MLEAVGAVSLEALIEATVPAEIRMRGALALPEARGEREALEELRSLAARNQVFRSFIGMGYSDCSPRRSSSATCWRIPAGTRPTRPTRPRSRRAGWRRC